MDSNRFKIYVSRDGNLETQVDYKVQIDAVQAVTENASSNASNNSSNNSSN